MAEGGIREQVTYPLSAAQAHLSDETLDTLLDTLGLGHLANATHADVMHLSGGEKQRLAMARLLFHRPAFALVDEGTSAVDPAMEEHFYATLRSLGIAFISVGHNQRLRAYHDRALVLLAEGRWKEVPVADLGDEADWDKLQENLFPSLDAEMDLTAATVELRTVGERQLSVASIQALSGSVAGSDAVSGRSTLFACLGFVGTWLPSLPCAAQRRQSSILFFYNINICAFPSLCVLGGWHGKPNLRTAR